jgi:uncharacterized membrane protein YhaH (DUF805 family)
MGLFQLLVSFEGRVGRATYWLTTFLYVAAILVVGVIVISPFVANGWRGSVSLTIPLLILLSPIGVKRLHDRNKSGWWLLAFYVAPVAVTYIPDTAADALQFVCSLVAFALSVWGFVELYCLRGAPRSNRFGADPLRPRY